jgi:hypothetical protein
VRSGFGHRINNRLFDAVSGIGVVCIGQSILAIYMV